MHQEYRIEGKPHIYDPVQFEKFCKEAGTTALFQNILMAITSSRQSDKKLEHNQQLAVAIIYKLCFGLSQMANYM